jgi:fluoroquinolone resistance protein
MTNKANVLLTAGCDLEEEDLTALDLDNVHLYEARLLDCKVIDSSWNAVKLNEAVLQVEFINSKLQGINFFEAKRSLLDLSFKNCLLRYCSFAELKLVGIKFIDCELEQVDFADAQLPEALFTGSKFTDCIFNNTDLSKADLRKARGYQIDPRINKLSKARFDLPEAVSLLAPFNIRVD